MRQDLTNQVTDLLQKCEDLALLELIRQLLLKHP